MCIRCVGHSRSSPTAGWPTSETRDDRTRHESRDFRDVRQRRRRHRTPGFWLVNSDSRDSIVPAAATVQSRVWNCNADIAYTVTKACLHPIPGWSGSIWRRLGAADSSSHESLAAANETLSLTTIGNIASTRQWRFATVDQAHILRGASLRQQEKTVDSRVYEDANQSV